MEIDLECYEIPRNEERIIPCEQIRFQPILADQLDRAVEGAEHSLPQRSPSAFIKPRKEHGKKQIILRSSKPSLGKTAEHQ